MNVAKALHIREHLVDASAGGRTRGCERIPDQNNARLDQNNARLDHYNARLDENTARLDENTARLDSVERRVDSLEQRVDAGFKECDTRWHLTTRQIAESEMRVSTEIVGLASITNEIRGLLRTKLEDHAMLLDHEHRIKALEADGARNSE